MSTNPEEFYEENIKNPPVNWFQIINMPRNIELTQSIINTYDHEYHMYIMFAISYKQHKYSEGVSKEHKIEKVVEEKVVEDTTKKLNWWNNNNNIMRLIRRKK